MAKNPDSILIVSLSPQIVVSFAKKYNTSVDLMYNILSLFFKIEFNASFVFDTSIGLEITMKESITEFIKYYTRNYITLKESHNENSNSNSNSSNNGNDNNNDESKQSYTNNKTMPLISGECPGWVCYAEKSCNEKVLSHISSVKSPQQIMGVLIKKYLFNNDKFQKQLEKRQKQQHERINHCHSNKMAINSNSVINNNHNNNTNGDVNKKLMQEELTRKQLYHVTVMPCFDKKLEASRKEFILSSDLLMDDSSDEKEKEKEIKMEKELEMNGIILAPRRQNRKKRKDNEVGIKEVDCVITNIEIQNILSDKNIFKSFDKYIENNKNNIDKLKIESNENNNSYLDGIIDFIDLSNNIDCNSSLNCNYSNTNCNSNDNNLNEDKQNDVEIKMDVVESGLNTDNYGSNGYMRNIFFATLSEIFGINSDNINQFNIKSKTLRNDDIEEFTLTLTDGQFNNICTNMGYSKITPKNRNKFKVLRFCRAYGFRNIQNIVKKIDKNKCSYDYIEIMACPYGCLNGGGQLRISEDKVEAKRYSVQKEHIGKLRMMHQEFQAKNKKQQIESTLKLKLKDDIVVDDNNKDKESKRVTVWIDEIVYQRVLKSKPGSEICQKLFHTTFNHVGDTLSTQMKIQW